MPRAGRSRPSWGLPRLVWTARARPCSGASGERRLVFLEGLPPRLVEIKACGTAQHRARDQGAWPSLRLMLASGVKPDVNCGRTDAADAEAVCEAVTRPTMRFVRVRSAEPPAVLMRHRTCDLLVRPRAMLVNARREHRAWALSHPRGWRGWRTWWPCLWEGIRPECRSWPAVIRHARIQASAEPAWLRGVLERCLARLASVARANTQQRGPWGRCWPGMAPAVWRVPCRPRLQPAGYEGGSDVMANRSPHT